MFFREIKNPQLNDISVPTIFFEQILPVIDAKFSKIYLYAYYLMISSTESEIIDNRTFANKLKLPLDEVLEAWDFLESCGLIKKHSLEDALIWDFSVEFVDLKSLYMKKTPTKSSVSTEELILLSKNEHLKAMFNKIEEILKTTLHYNEYRTINQFMKEYNVPTDLVVEAFSFSAGIKKIKTVSGALSVLRTWYIDGVRTKEDLQLHLENRHKRYFTYRKILAFLGEYRLPTKAEEKLMDTWLDDMKFSIEVIEKAFEKALAIKTPNLKYVNGILENWHKKFLSQNLFPSTNNSNYPEDKNADLTEISGEITLSKIQNIIDEKSIKTSTSKAGLSTRPQSVNSKLNNDELEEKLMKKRQNKSNQN